MDLPVAGTESSSDNHFATNNCNKEIQDDYSTNRTRFSQELRGARLFARPVLERLVMLIFAHVDNDIVNDIRKATNGNYALGNDHFKKEIDQMQTTTRFWITII